MVAVLSAANDTAHANIDNAITASVFFTLHSSPITAWPEIVIVPCSTVYMFAEMPCIVLPGVPGDWVSSVRRENTAVEGSWCVLSHLEYERYGGQLPLEIGVRYRYYGYRN
jgi:hypothetical protein